MTYIQYEHQQDQADPSSGERPTQETSMDFEHEAEYVFYCTQILKVKGKQEVVVQ